MKVTLDRIEGSTAVLYVRDGESIMIELPVSLLPAGCVEGDILDVTICRDPESTEVAKQRVSSLIEKLKNKSVK